MLNGKVTIFLASILALRADTGEYVWHYRLIQESNGIIKPPWIW